MTGNLNEGNFDESNFERLNVERLLTAYFDNELEPAERVEVETMLAENPDLRGLLDQWQNSGDSLRRLPTYSLGAEFSAGVRSKIDATAVATAAVATQRSPATAASIWDSQRIGMGGIAALAALLLLTLFVFPSLVGDGHDQQAALVVKEAADREPTGPPETPLKERPKPIIAPRNSSLPRNPGRFPRMASTGTKSRGVEQVLLIQNAALSDLEAILSRHEIRIVDSKGKTLDGENLIAQAKQGMEAIHVVSEKASMQNAISEIADHESVTVTAYTMPGQLGSRAISNSKSAKTEESSALQLQPRDFSGSAEIAREINDLNDWFKLDDEEQGGEPVECLLLIQSPSQR